MICYPNFNGRLGAIHISDVRPCFFIEIETLNLVRILLVWNGIQVYAYKWAYKSMHISGYGPRSGPAETKGPKFYHYFFYQDRRLKFGRRNAHTKWNTMICIREDKLPQRLQSGPCVGPKAQLRPSSGASLEVTAGQHLGVSVVVPVWSLKFSFV